MTKIYIKPETNTIKVEFQQIMAGSTLDSDLGEITDPLARENNFGFFEEEDIEEEY